MSVRFIATAAILGVFACRHLQNMHETNHSAATTASAQGYGGYGGGGYNGGYNGGNYPGSSSSGSGSGNGNYGYAAFDYGQASTIRLAHGVLASLAFVVFFPFGAISIRVIPSKVAFYLHVAFQVLGYLTFIAAFGLGVYLAREVHFGSFRLVCLVRSPSRHGRS